MTTTPQRPRRRRARGILITTAISRFLEYLQSYRGYPDSTITAYRSDLTQFIAFLREKAPEISTPRDITRATTMEFALALSGLAPMTIRRKIACLSSFFSFLQDVGEMDANPTRRLRLPKKPREIPRAISLEDAQRLVTAAHTPWHRCLLVLLLTTGMRRSEATSIKLGDIDLDDGQLLVHGKGAKERVVPLTAAAQSAIRNYLQVRHAPNCDSLFVSQTGESIQGRIVNKMLNHVIGRAQLWHRAITPHTLRHTFATYLVRNGTDIRTIQELLGHADIQSTARYLHSDTRTKQSAVDRVSDLLMDLPEHQL